MLQCKGCERRGRSDTSIISCDASLRDGTETGDNYKTRTLDWKISWSCVTATACLPEPLVNAVVTISTILGCMSCDVRCGLPSPINTAIMIEVTCRISEQAKQAEFPSHGEPLGWFTTDHGCNDGVVFPEDAFEQEESCV